VALLAWTMLWPGAGQGQLAAEGQTSKPKAETPPGLEMVPADGSGFVTVRVAELFRNRITNEIRERLATDRPNYTEDVRRATGLDISDIERVTVILPSSHQQEPVVVISTIRPLAKDRVLQAMLPQSEVRMLKDKSVYVGKGERARALHFASGRVLLAAPKMEMVRFLSESRSGREGPLADGLRLASKSHLVVAGLNLEGPLFRELGKNLRGEAKVLEPLFAANPGVLTLVSNGDSRIDLRLTFTDEKAAKEGTSAIRSGIKMAQKYTAEGQKEMGDLLKRRNLDNFARWYLTRTIPFLKQLEQEIPNTAVKPRKGNGLDVSLRMKANAADLVSFVGGWLFVGFSAEGPARPAPARPIKP
jgi:hypothetical protein